MKLGSVSMFAYEIPFKVGGEETHCCLRSLAFWYLVPFLASVVGISESWCSTGPCTRKRHPVLFWAEACHTDHWFTVSLVKVCKSVSMMLERNVWTFLPGNGIGCFVVAWGTSAQAASLHLGDAQFMHICVLFSSHGKGRKIEMIESE